MLARVQTLRLAIGYAPTAGRYSLDPALVGDQAVMTAIGENVFDGLYRLDGRMRETPDLASDLPHVSPDGLTYTFALRRDARFWNGDPVTASDFVYTWSRAAAMQGDWSFAFQAVAGYPSHLDLSAPNAHTLVAHLSAPAGYWLAELELPAAWVVDRKVVDVDPAGWWKEPQTLVGTGPFRMTSIGHDELDFAPVARWWGGSSGALTQVELHVASPGDAWAGYATGAFDMLGYGEPDLGARSVAQVAALRDNPATRSQVHSSLYGTTDWIAFNLQSGVFSGSGTGLELRRAFSEAIDRKKLAFEVCDGGTVCIPATGGVIAKGLSGYLGDGADPGADFDPVAARAIIDRVDPTRAELSQLTYYYPVPGFDATEAAAHEVAQQWSDNLGVRVAVEPLDRTAYLREESHGDFTLWRLGWQADYDEPQDWFDNLFIGRNVGTVYERPGFSDLIASADRRPLVSALPDYRLAGEELAGDYAYAALYYLARTVVIKPYVDGYSANALVDDRWTSLRIIQT